MTTISIGKYLIHRLKEVGIETIFGVPGDYNMVKKNCQKVYLPSLLPQPIVAYILYLYIYISLCWTK